jgi:hypothetical protein
VDGEWVAVLAASTTALGYLGKWILDAYKQRGETRRTERKDAIDEVWKYAADLKGQTERQQAIIEQHGRAVEALSRENADCREESAEQQSSIHFLYDYLKRLHRTLKDDCHQDPGELPELPARRPRPTGPDAHFLASQATQSAALSREAAQTIQPPGGAPP